MKRLLILLLGLVLTMPIDNALNATEPIDSNPQATSDGWEKIGRIAIYKAESFRYTNDGVNFSRGEESHYAHYLGEGDVHLKNIQGFRSIRIQFNNIYYYPSRQETTMYQYKFSSYNQAANEDKLRKITFQYKLGEYYYCNL